MNDAGEVEDFGFSKSDGLIKTLQKRTDPSGGRNDTKRARRVRRYSYQSDHRPSIYGVCSLIRFAKRMILACQTMCFES